MKSVRHKLPISYFVLKCIYFCIPFYFILFYSILMLFYFVYFFSLSIFLITNPTAQLELAQITG